MESPTTYRQPRVWEMSRRYTISPGVSRLGADVGSPSASIMISGKGVAEVYRRACNSMKRETLHNWTYKVAYLQKVSPNGVSSVYLLSSRKTCVIL